MVPRSQENLHPNPDQRIHRGHQGIPGRQGEPDAQLMVHPPKSIPGCFEFEGTNHNTRHFEPVTFREIEEMLKSTSNTSAPSSTGIGYKILKWALTTAPDEMTAIIKASIKLGTHHPRWKSSLVMVIPKVKKPSYSDPKAWRPIQLLDTLCQGRPQWSPEIQSTLVWNSCWGATGGAGRSTQRGEQRKVVRARGNKGEVGVTRDQCCVW